MSLFDSIMSDTVGVVYRGATGNVDPWTKQEIVDQAAADQVKAGADPTTAQTQAEQDVTDTLKTFSLGGDDKTGADPSQASLSLPSFQALLDTVRSVNKNDGSGCGLTNLGGCFTIPTWAKWAAAGVIVVGTLYILAPYVGLASNLTRRS